MEPIEIIKINQHISSWEKLVPGTKIRLPSISNQLSAELDEVEPFIEDYYPKIELPIKPETPNVEEVKEQTSEVPLSESKKKNNNHKPLMYNPYYMYPYPYMYNNYYHTPRKKKSR